MFHNNEYQPLFHNNYDNDDAVTVQVSDANSNLGNLLLEADWNEALDYLATPEGQHDVNDKNDPLGLFSKRSSNTKIEHGQIPNCKNTSFFAALLVRAPYKVIERICTMDPSQVDQPQDLMYALSIIPSEEEARSQELHRKIPYRTRTWSVEEYEQILNLLVQSFVSSASLPSVLLDCCPSWVIGNSNVVMTSLAVSAYNPDVSVTIVQLLCALEPNAIEKECKFHGRQIPLIIAAASPLPPKPSAGYSDAKNRRWKKVKLMVLSKAAWHDGQGEMLTKTPLTAAPPPEPSLQQVQYACGEAIQRNEWELVREFLKHYHSGETASNVGVELMMKGEFSVFDPIHAAMLDHDIKVNAAAGRRQSAKEKSQARDEWLHNNMGLVKYPLDAVLDLVSAVMPTSKYDAAAGRIVLRMS